MNLFDILKQFKNIEPDAAFKEKSKRAILATTPREPFHWRNSIVHIFESGIAVGLAVFFILIITGRLWGAPGVSPAQFSEINPETLHAEAQAVDIQIQLAKIVYQESTTTNESTAQAVAATLQPSNPAVASPVSAAASTTATSTEPTTTSTSTQSSTISVDQALQQLAN